MKSFKKILLIFIAAFLLVLPIGGKLVNVEVNAEEAKKVKVYIFEAGGCPFCEQEKEYLQGLESYGVKFEIVTKQLYVDHINWAQGADYELGKKVATAFNEAGFEQAQYTATPFVVISDLYAAAIYSEDLEQYIDKAYNEGDKDVVGCYANGGSNCLPGVKEEVKEEGISPDTICLIIMIVFVVGTVIFVILSRRSTRENSDFEIERYVNEKKHVEEEMDNEEEIIVEEPKKKDKTEKNPKKTTKNNTSTKTNKTSKSKTNKKNK